MSYIIQTERIGLRLWKKEDIIPFAEMNKDADVMKYFPHLLSYEETSAMVKRINLHFEKHGFGLFAIEELSAKKFIGFAGFMIPSFQNYFTPCVEIGWRLQKNAWHKGYATQAAKACLQYGFEVLHFDTVYSFTSAGNIASEKVMQRIGMAKVGVFEHPNIAADDWLCLHVLYKIEREECRI